MKTKTTAFVWLSAALWLGCQGSSDNAQLSTPAEKGKQTDRVMTISRASRLAALESEWRMDTDHNGIPDFIEKQLGYTPDYEDCETGTACGGAEPGADLDLAVNTLIMLDVSGSMAARLGNVPKIDLAKMSLLRYTSSVPESIRLGLLVYGHKGSNEESGKAESCAGVEVMAPIGALREGDVRHLLDRFTPTGWTPIASSLEQAKQVFGSNPKGRNRIIMISDGIETCGGNPVQVARELYNAGFAVTTDVVGLHVPGSSAQQLKAIAEAGGGIYFDARTQSALDRYFQEQNRAVAKTWEAANCYAEAFNKAWLCDASMVLQALRVVNARRREAQSEGNLDKVRALDEIRNTINQKHQDRKRERKLTQDQWKQLSRQAFELNQKTLKAYGKLRRDT